MKEIVLLSLIVFQFHLNAFALENLCFQDSIKTEIKDGKKNIVYEVEPSESLSSIAKKYNITVNNILASNPQLKNSAILKVKQIINIPVIINTEYYMIKPGDNLFRIARKTGMSVNRLKEINNIENQYISPGQMLLIEKLVTKKQSKSIEKIEKNDSVVVVKDSVSGNENFPLIKEKVKVPIYHIVKNGEGLFRISKNYKLTIDSLINLNKIDRNKPLKKGQRLLVGFQSLMPPNYNIGNKYGERNNVSKDIKLETPINKDIANSEKSSNIHEKGNGERVIADNIDNKTIKTAFHKTIPIGTFIRVSNPSNGLSTVVRVIARIPDTDRNKDVMIKLSQAACDALGLVNDKFPIEIAYNLSNN